MYEIKISTAFPLLSHHSNKRHLTNHPSRADKKNNPTPNKPILGLMEF